MVFSPLQILSLWFRGVISVALIVGSIYLFREWYERSHVRADTGAREDRRDNPAAAHRFDPQFGWNLPTATVLAAAGMTVWSLGGGLVLTRMRRRRGNPADERHLTHERAGESRLVRREDGTSIYAESDGPADAPVLVFTHGAGANGAEWNAVRPFLRERYRIVTWDLAGLGHATDPDRDFSLERHARDLRLVVEAAAGERPVVLVGHSIGGMIMLTMKRLFPDFARDRVVGMVFAHTTYTNPLRTHSKAGLYTALQNPLVEPLAYATIPLSPVLWGLNYLSYLNGAAHRSMGRSGFSGRETRGQLDFAAKFILQASPAVVARMTLGMLHWDASEVPPTIESPSLVTVGGRDPTTRPDAGERIARAIPEAELWGLEEAKHMGPIEFDREFAGQVAAFAYRCFGAGGSSIVGGLDATRGDPVRTPGSTHDEREDGKTAPDRFGGAEQTRLPKGEMH